MLVLQGRPPVHSVIAQLQWGAMAARWVFWTVVAVLTFLWASTVLGVAFVLAREGANGWWVVPPLGFLPFAAVLFLGRRRAGSLPEPQDAVSVDEEKGSPAPLPEGLEPELTAREGEVLVLLAEGLTNRQIAQNLYVSPATVKSHVNAICRKLRATNRTQAVANARQRRLLPG